MCADVGYGSEHDSQILPGRRNGRPTYLRTGVACDEVEYVLRHPGEDLPARDGARQTLGQTSAGRYLRVIYVPDPQADGIFVVTAFELRGKPLAAFRRRHNRRRRT
jgi:hypothetical protein